MDFKKVAMDQIVARFCESSELGEKFVATCSEFVDAGDDTFTAVLYVREGFVHGGVEFARNEAAFVTFRFRNAQVVSVTKVNRLAMFEMAEDRFYREVF